MASSLSSAIEYLPHTWMAPMEPVRQPLFSVPSLALTSTFATPALDFYPFNLYFWLEMLAIFLVIAALAALVGVVVYQFIVRKEMHFTPTSYLVGYGLILPFWLCFPSVTVHFFGVKNKIIRFMMTVTTPAICVFRTTAAMHGFSPEHVTHSTSGFAFYYACPILAKYNPKTKQYTKVTRATILSGIQGFVLMAFLSGLVGSIYAIHPDTFPSLSKSKHTEPLSWYHWARIFNLKQFWDNICYAVIFQFYLTTFAEGLMLIQAALTTYEPEQNMMSNPVFSSTSPSDFWGRRWNALIHDVLKRGVYLPVRRYFSTNVALMACFFASGMYHEWLCISCFPSWDHEYTVVMNGTTDDRTSNDKSQGTCRLLDLDGDYEAVHCYEPAYGAAMGFFMWQAMLIAMEFSLGRTYKSLIPANVKVPDPVATIITIGLGGCVAHWFAEPYVHSNFFLDGEQAFFVWKRSSS